MKKIILGLLVVLCSIIGLARVLKNVDIEQNCFGYLELAAFASTPQIALTQMQKATKYLEKNNLTKGYTSILYQTPDEDISFWYTNLKESEAELKKVTDQTSALEKSNLLMKLRETLLDRSGSDTILKTPHGLVAFPNNKLWGLAILIVCITFIGLIISVFMHLDRIPVYDNYFKFK
jgi:hypothetical protein